MHVASLHRYPVKSMLGEQLDQAVLDDRGVLGDRGYAVVALEDGTVASAKHPRKWGALLRLSARYTVPPVAGEPLPTVVVTFPDGSEHDNHEVDGPLSALLDRDVRLTSQVVAGSRFEEQWPDIDGLAPVEFVTDTTTSYEGSEPVSALEIGMLAPPGTFFDLAVLHLLTTSTLQALAELAPGPAFDARRYRPNVLVDDAPDGFTEDDWVAHSVRLGDQARIEVSMLAMRCVMTTLAQQGLAEDRDTLRAIARHHRREIPGLGTWACAGVYAGVGAGGTVRVGDPVAVQA